MAETPRQRYEILRVSLENERSSFLTHWRDLGDFILPRRPRFTLSDTNRGERRNQRIIDSTATLAARTLRSGMMAGVTSPARPWFRLTTPDPDLADFAPVKDWLHTVTQRMSTALLRSNVYNALPILYGDMGVFGTSAMGIEEDFTGAVIRCFPFPIGSYCIANDSRLRVAVFFREFRYTVRQLIEKFGRRDGRTGAPDWSNFSAHVKNAYDRGHYEMWVDICHVITPNDDYNPQMLHAKFKRFKSCYYEKGRSQHTSASANYMSGAGEDAKILRESGFDLFPALCPRWETTGEDAYATTCPGMEALGDIKQLQMGERRAAQAIEKMVNPPLVGPAMLAKTRTSLLPGDITFSDEREGQKGLRPIHEVNPRIQELEMKQEQVRGRVQRAFFEDLFLMLATDPRTQPATAREIEERHEEKLLALGPVLEQLNQDLLDPLIDITFEIMNRQGLLPEAPEELQDDPTLKVEYVSVMAQAQKLAGISGIERFAGFVGQIAVQAADPTILDKVDIDQMIDEYGNITGVPPRIIRPDKDVEEIRGERAKAQKAQQDAATLREVTGAAKDLSGSKMDEDNALTRLVKTANAGALVQA